MCYHSLVFEGSRKSCPLDASFVTENSLIGLTIHY